MKVGACGVCRTDLHVVDAELPDIKYPVVPDREIAGWIDLIGRDVVTRRTGDRAGIPWLGHTCGVCRCQAAAVMWSAEGPYRQKLV